MSEERIIVIDGSKSLAANVAAIVGTDATIVVVDEYEAFEKYCMGDVEILMPYDEEPEPPKRGRTTARGGNSNDWKGKYHR